MKLILIFFALFSFAAEDEGEVMLSPECAGLVKKTGLPVPFIKTCPEAFGVSVDVTFVQGSSSEIPYEKWLEITQENNVVQGSFIEWSKAAAFKRIEGSIKKEKPNGTWTIKDYGNKDQIQVTYDDSNKLNKIVITEGKEKPVTIKIAKLEAKPRVSRKTLGMSMPLTVDPIFPNEFNRSESDRIPGEFSMDHVLFYSSPTKKETVGAAITNYRFYPGHVCTSAQCDSYQDGPNHVWLVHDKKDDMCMTAMPAQNFWEKEYRSSHVYELWFECKKFTDIYDSYVDKSLGINSGTTVYSSPNGKITKIKGLDGEELGPLSANMVGKKMIGKDLWVEIHITAGDKDLDFYWIPFFQGDQTTLFVREEG